MALSGLLFVAAFVVAGLNWRFQWCVLPDWAVWVAAVLFLVCYLLHAEVLRENTYLSRTIEVQEHQKVVNTGLYGIVRHPMYMATTILFLMMPLVLASPISFLIMLLYIPLIAKRIRNEEAVLEQVLHDNGWQVIVVWECQLMPKILENTMLQVELKLNENFLALHQPKPKPYALQEDADMVSMAAED